LADLQQLLLLALLLLCDSVAVVRAKVVAAAVLPHGDFALDPALVDNTNGSLQVHRACVRVSAYLRTLQPDIIILTSPHGIELQEDFAWYENTKGHGHADIGQDLHDPTIQPCEYLSLSCILEKPCRRET